MLSSFLPMPFYLVNTSIIFIVEVSNPQLFTSNYLEKLGVLPKDARIDSSVTLPGVSQITYNDQYSFEAVQQRVSLQEELALPKDGIENGFSISDLEISDDIRDAALSLIDVLKPYRLESVGINFRVFAPNADLDQFLKSIPSNSKPVSLRFFIDVDGLQANYTLNTVTTADHTPPLTGLLVDTNFDGQIQDMTNDVVRAEQIAKLVQKRNDFFQFMKGTLDVLNIEQK